MSEDKSYILLTTMELENHQSSIGSRLRRFLAFAGLSIREFSKLAGIPYGTIQGYLADIRAPGAEHLAKMADVGLDLHWLVTGKLRPPIRLDYPSEDWPEVAEKVGAFGPELRTALFDLAFDLAEQFSGRFQSRHDRALTVREAFSAFAFFHLTVMRWACQLVPLLTAASKTAPRVNEIRSRIAAAVTPDLDPAAEATLRRLV
jgi:transcriptional regulator with XRE-family HTH domain